MAVRSSLSLQSAPKAVIRIVIRLRSDYDASRVPTSIRREQKMNMSIFRHSHVVVVSQSNRTQIVISITFLVVECVVVVSSKSLVLVLVSHFCT